MLVRGIPTEDADALWSGGDDAYGNRPLERVAEGLANPCRHCLQLIAPGEKKLVLAYRPFVGEHPYAECGPIFLHETRCELFTSSEMPSWFAYMDAAIIRGYDHDDWICYDTGKVVPGAALADASREILHASHVAYVHIRSKFNCFQCRVDRSDTLVPSSVGEE